MVRAGPFLQVTGLAGAQINELLHKLHKRIPSFDDWVGKIRVYDAVQRTGSDPVVLHMVVNKMFYIVEIYSVKNKKLLQVCTHFTFEDI